MPWVSDDVKIEMRRESECIGRIEGRRNEEQKQLVPGLSQRSALPFRTGVSGPSTQCSALPFRAGVFDTVPFDTVQRVAVSRWGVSEQAV